MAQLEVKFVAAICRLFVASDIMGGFAARYNYLRQHTSSQEIGNKGMNKLKSKPFIWFDNRHPSLGQMPLVERGHSLPRSKAVAATMRS